MACTRELYRRLVEHGDNAALVLDARGRVVYCTPATERWLNAAIPRAEASPFQLIHPGDAPEALRHFRELLLEPDASVRLVVRVRDASQAWRTLHIAATNAMTDPAVGGLLIWARDITDTERLKRALEHAQRMELMGRLAAGAAHDFNNALTVILSHADLLAARRSASPDLGLSNIRAAALGAAALARQLLSLGKRTSGLATDVDVNRAIEMLQRLLRPVLGEGISLVCIPATALTTVYVDPIRLDQALINLVFNARDAMGSLGVIRIVADYIEADSNCDGRAGGQLRLRVIDNGHGMPPGVVARAFEPHFTTKARAGSGLGLPMVRDFVVEAGGTISVSSTPRVGTTVEIVLPARRAETGPTESAAVPTPGGDETIVVIEDDTAVRQSVARMLHDAGYTVLEVATAIDGVWLADELLSRAALVVADELLSDSLGHELMASFRHRKPDLPVLYMSGHPISPELARRLDERTRFVPKPFERAALLHEIRALIHLDRAENTSSD